jgi:acyl carrier protein
VAPRTSVEQTIAKIWAEVLYWDEVGIHDNFFDLGGHSLGASRVISRVIQTFQQELPLNALFDSPTVAGMAKVIEQNRAKASGVELTRMLSEVDAMPEEEVQKLLVAESGRS